MKRDQNTLIGAAALLVPALLIAGCDSGGTTSGPGAVSEGEARALEEAAEMLGVGERTLYRKIKEFDL